MAQQKIRIRLKAYDHEGQLVINKDGILQKDLPDYIGKDAAEKLVTQKPISKLWDIEQSVRTRS